MKTKMYRLKVGERYCSLDTRMHEDGVAIPDVDRASAHVVRHINTANAIIARTHRLRDEVKGSMLADWPKFKPLLFDGRLEHEEFEVEEAK